MRDSSGLVSELPWLFYGWFEPYNTLFETPLPWAKNSLNYDTIGLVSDASYENSV